MLTAIYWSAEASAKVAFDAALTSSQGVHVSLSQYRGRPVILFYEDRHSTHLNRPLKQRLREWGAEHAAFGSAHVLGVANLKAYNFFPLKDLALRQVRGVEQRVGTPILADFDGTLSQPPWSLPEASSTVVIFDRSGHLVYEKTGALSEGDITAVLDTIERLLTH